MTGSEFELAKYGSTGVALAVIAILFYIVRYAVTKIDKAFDKVEKSMEANTKATIENTKVTHETYDFLATLNGDLKAVIRKKRRVSK